MDEIEWPDKPKHEPSADQRSMAQTFMGWYVSFREQGFTEAQAIRLIGEVVRAGRDDIGDA